MGRACHAGVDELGANQIDGTIAAAARTNMAMERVTTVSDRAIPRVVFVFSSSSDHAIGQCLRDPSLTESDLRGHPKLQGYTNRVTPGSLPVPATMSSGTVFPLPAETVILDRPRKSST
jgi:hypothetical protein